MKALLAVVVFVLALSTLGAIIAVNQGLPAEFGGKGDADKVLGEFLTRGTAMSPPLAPLVILAILAAAATVRNVVGSVALAAIMVVAVLFAIGGIWEPNNPAGSDMPTAMHVVLKFSGVVASVAVALLAGWDLIGRVRRVRL
jgi:hypothetical protein